MQLLIKNKFLKHLVLFALNWRTMRIYALHIFVFHSDNMGHFASTSTDFEDCILLFSQNKVLTGSEAFQIFRSPNIRALENKIQFIKEITHISVNVNCQKPLVLKKVLRCTLTHVVANSLNNKLPEITHHFEIQMIGCLKMIFSANIFLLDVKPPDGKTPNSHVLATQQSTLLLSWKNMGIRDFPIWQISIYKKLLSLFFIFEKCLLRKSI